jgi:hypothetical protein
MDQNYKKEIINNQDENNKELSNKYGYYFNFDIKYSLLSQIFKDIQLVSQLVKSVHNNQLSDIIFIKGNNSYSIDSRFYLNYQKIIEFYIKVLDYVETDNSIQLKYLVYKTVPKSKSFIVNLVLFYINDKSSKLSFDIILSNNVALNQKIVDIIFKEININFIYLSQAIKSNKHQFLYYSSNIIESEFFLLTQIVKNIKLIDYTLNGKFEKIGKEISDNNEKSCVHVNELYKIILKKKNSLAEYINAHKVMFKINLIKIRDDNIIIHYKVVSDNNDRKSNIDSNMNNIVTIYIRKITSNSSFILIKYAWDVFLKEDIIISIKNIINKIIIRIEKLCKIAKQ